MYTPVEIGKAVRAARKVLGVTQKQLAFTAGTGMRFITDLENGKPTCEFGKVLTVLHTLGIKLSLDLPGKNIFNETNK